MRHCVILLAVLLMAHGSGARADKTAEAKAKAVVVDPVDLKPPLEDPEAALSEKYDGKPVRFTGVVTNKVRDPKTKAIWYELSASVPGGKKKETVQVKVVLAEPDARLQRAQGKPTVTVEGQAGIVPGTHPLVISGAKVVAYEAATPFGR
jgi:hypothetical protein